MNNLVWPHSMMDKITNRTDIDIRRNLDSRYSFLNGEIINKKEISMYSENSLVLDNKNFNVDMDFKLGKISKDTPKFITSDKNSSVIYIRLFINKIIVDLTGCTIDVNVKNPEGSTFTVPCTVIDNANGLVEFVIPDKCKSIKGDYDMEVLVSVGIKEVATPITKYYVSEGIGRTSNQVMQNSIMTNLGEEILTNNENPILYREEDVLWRKS